MEDELKTGETDVRERTWELLRSAKRANRSLKELLKKNCKLH